MSPNQKSPPRAQSTGQDARKQYSAATVRKTIIQVLADKPTGYTTREIERSVADLLPTADRASVSEQVDALREGEYITRVPGQPGRVRLSERGESWWTGIRALTPAAA
jgi:Fe2+ or Zn2+ uptake regulation protein